MATISSKPLFFIALPPLKKLRPVNAGLSEKHQALSPNQGGAPGWVKK
jgi:hypothetical protein